MGEQYLSTQFQTESTKPPIILALVDEYNDRYKDYQPRYEEDQYSRKIEDFLITAWQKSGVFSAVCHTPRKLDEDEGIDIFAELPSGRVIAIDATFTHDPKKQLQKARKMSIPARPIKEFEPKGRIPLVPHSFDENKYRGRTEEVDAESRGTQVGLLRELEKMLLLKKQEMLKNSSRPEEASINSFYDGYLKELSEEIEKLKNRPTQEK